MLHATQRPPPASSSTFVPLSPQLSWAGQGTRLPSARLQHKAEPGRGRPFPGPLAWKAPLRLGRARHGNAPSGASSTSVAQKLGSSGSLAFRGQLPGTSRCRLGPAHLQHPTESSRAPRPPAYPTQPWPGSLGQRARPLPRRLRCAQTCLPAKGPGARDRRRLGSKPAGLV